MFLIAANYESDNHSRKKIFWGKSNRYCICELHQTPNNSWVIDFGIASRKHTDKKLNMIPTAIFVYGRNYYLKAKQVVEYNWRDL